MNISTAKCRHGTFKYFADDTFVGRSLKLYGEYSEAEWEGLNILLGPGNVVIEVGSNIGALTVPMAKAIGPLGKLYAFEPQPATAALLRENLSDNGIDNVVVHQTAAGPSKSRVRMPALTELTHNNFGRAEIGHGSLVVLMQKIDDLELPKLSLLKIDAEGSEIGALGGAEKTIMRCRPMIYIENDRREKSLDLIGWLVDHGYRCFWHRPFLFNPKNFAEEKRNVFGVIASFNMLCVPTDVKGENGYFEVNGLDEVCDLRVRPDMYEREAKRFAIEVEHHPTDKTARLLVAYNRGLMGDVDGARKLIEENLKLDPAHAASIHIKGLLDLQAGNYKDGWKGYEARYLIKETAQLHFGGNRKFDVPMWDGKPTDDTILIWCEQGFGDNIMFARFMRNVLELAPNAILETQPQLYELFEISGIAPKMYRRGRTLPPYTAQCSLPSLPYVLKLYSEDQLRSASYLKVDPLMLDTWQRKLEDVPFRIGACYRGSPRSERPWSRDIDPAVIDPMLQKYAPLINLNQEGQFESFADSAACISALDIVVTVDTSVGHLAGALGVPTYLLLSSEPDWRWGLGGYSAPWYDSVKIFRQKKFLDWSNVVQEVETALENDASIDAIFMRA
jgi:FkbM family methyltransferase